MKKINLGFQQMKKISMTNFEDKKRLLDNVIFRSMAKHTIFEY